MILENQLDVAASPDDVFALINDPERVVGCLPGAVLDGRDGDTYRGTVKFKVGPISAAYSGTIRFSEVDTENHRVRLSARGADAHGNGDAEADVTIVVTEASGGSVLDLRTDLSVRGKIAQFGKSAINTVFGRLLGQFASNLTDQLAGPPAGEQADGAGVTTSSIRPASPAAAAPGGEAFDGLAMLVPPGLARHAPVIAAAALGLFQGWLLGRIRTQDKLIKELQRGRR